ncbi:hypothetical protein B4143_2023 [Bacillus subtilis]|nr:hypothetical protein B4143_2023 [Bacillus subtilis]
MSNEGKQIYEEYEELKKKTIKVILRIAQLELLTKNLRMIA